MIAYQQAAAPAATLPPQTIVDNMVERMLELGMNGTAVTADSLFEHSNFTRAEIEKHGPEASDLARTRSIRKVA